MYHNIFEHNTSFYKQFRGTAIETKMAPRYAIFMGELEKKLLKDCDKKPLAWWPYIDYIFMLWQHSEKKELKKFLEFLNCYHPTIKFTANHSREEINVLHVSVRQKDNQLLTDLYINPTDTH